MYEQKSSKIFSKWKVRRINESNIYNENLLKKALLKEKKDEYNLKVDKVDIIFDKIVLGEIKGE